MNFLIAVAFYLPKYASKPIASIEIKFLKVRIIGENANFNGRVIGRGSVLEAYNLNAN